MPSVQENQEVWGGAQNWKDLGHAWSEPWGGVESHWWFSMLPRIHRFLPTGTILEIAPGMGRWTQFLKDAADKLIVVDLSQACIDRCRDRFHEARNIEYYCNDGKSLEMVPDGSVDFVFSFDSLVHCEADVLEAYIAQLSRKLKPTGVGFIHHSNLGQHKLHRLPVGKRILHMAGLLDNANWRGKTMSAEKFRAFCKNAGIRCVSQELINWHGKYCIDCLSVFTKDPTLGGPECQVVENRDHMRQAAIAKRIAALYCESLDGSVIPK